MNPEEDPATILERKKEQDRLRQANFYEKNKDIVTERRRIAYQANKEKISEARKANYAVKKAEAEPVVKTVANNGRALNAVSDDNINTKYIEYFKTADYSEHTKLRYIGDMKRVIQLVGTTPIVESIKSGNFKKLLTESNYGESTKLGMAKTVLSGLTGLGIKLTKKVFRDYQIHVEVLTKAVTGELKEKQENDTVIRFDDYIPKVKTKFGENSKMHLIALLYNELTLRDDFQLEIVEKAPKKSEHNYIVMSGKRLRVIISKYKTEKQYGVISELLAQNLSTRIKNYVMVNALKVGDYLFGDAPLSNFILYSNKQIGVEGGVSMYRHMKVTEITNEKSITPEELIRLSLKMKHSPLVQLQYIRKLSDSVTSSQSVERSDT